MTRRFTIAVLLLLSVYVVGGIGFKFFSPQTPFLDCLYISVITVASVGFTEVIDSTGNPAVRIYIMMLILFGVAIHLYAVSVVTAFLVEGDLSHYFWKKRMTRKIGSMSEHYVVCGAGETGTCEGLRQECMSLTFEWKIPIEAPPDRLWRCD